jgi:PAS domain S-box-containing protein
MASLHRNHAERAAGETNLSGATLRIRNLDPTAAEGGVQEDFYRLIFERGGIGMGVLNPLGVVLRVNQALASQFGMPPEEIAGRRLLDFVVAGDAAPLGEWFERAARGPMPPCMLECRILPRSGAPAWTLLTLSQLEHQGPGAGQIFLMLQDIGERKRIESERARLHERLAQDQRMRALGALAGGVAHDFNNLLGVISGSMSLLRLRLPKEDPLQQVLSTMQLAAGRAEELTQQLLHFSRQEPLQLRPLRIESCLENVLKMVSQTFDRRIRVEQQMAEGLPPVMGDAGQIELALLNLCLNARDAMPKGGVLRLAASRVTLSSRDLPPDAPGPEGDYVRIEVSDTGVGMDGDVINQIFEPFFTTKKGRKGMGLGLALVHSTVTQMRGLISVRSQRDRGTSIILHLPVALQSAEVESLRPCEPEGRGKGTVLVVDDEPLMADFTSAAVSELGYSALATTDGRDVVRLCAETTPPVDAVLLDMVMPGPSWETTLRALCSLRPAPKVILVSGYNRQQEAQRGLELGAASFLGKPFTIEQLGRALKDSLSGRKN